jgi:hypothetical protein
MLSYNGVVQVMVLVLEPALAVGLEPTPQAAVSVAQARHHMPRARPYQEPGLLQSLSFQPPSDLDYESCYVVVLK